MCWIVVREKDSENIDFPITAWTIATKKYLGQIHDNLVYRYTLKLYVMYVSKNNLIDLIDKSRSCLRLQMVGNLRVQVIAKYLIICLSLSNYYHLIVISYFY